MWNDSASELAPLLKNITSSGQAHRGLASLAPACFMVEAAKKLHTAENVAVCTGFYIPSARAAETDGPIGSAALARACQLQGAAATVVTDRLCEPVVAAAARTFGVPLVVLNNADELKAMKPDVICFVERPGRADDGHAWSMHHHRLPEDFVFFDDLLPPAASQAHWVTIAIGDGGNEAGMGRWKKEMAALNGAIAPSLARSEAQWPLTADVSDWGAWALAALLSGNGFWCGLETQELEQALHSLVAAGAVEGTTGQPTASIDGYDLSACCSVLESLNELCRSLASQSF